MIRIHHHFAVCVFTILAAGTAFAQRPQVDFTQDIQPLLQKRCVDCHGGDSREGGLRLDRRRSALAGGDTGRVIIPGKPDESKLIQRVTETDPDRVMPPDGEPLTEAEVDLLRRWIEAGAEWPASADSDDARSDHWAYQPLAPGDVPQIHAPQVHNAIDAYVQHRLAQDRIEPSPAADRKTLIKRLYYDLLGLPPTIEAIDRFLADDSGQAYEKLVDELLRSPHFGERWGRHWLDIARYADSDGYEKDRPRYNAWRYRDWVIQAVNDDMPFDQFTVEQLAGDLLPNRTSDQWLATAFNRQTLTNTEGGTDPEQWRVEAVFDRVETLGTAWLGLTVGCARCHTHKYDELTQREYYQLFAFFNNGDEQNTNVATNAAAMERYLSEKQTFDEELARRMQPLQEAEAAARPGYDAWEEEQLARIAALRERPLVDHPLSELQITSDAGAEFTIAEDGSVLVTGERPVQDVYTIEFDLELEDVSGIKLEVLPHDSLPAKGPGRGDNGNFVLSELTVSAPRSANALNDRLRLDFVGATADFFQNEFPPTKAFDGAEDATGWAISPQMGRAHHAQFMFDEPALNRLAALPRPVRISIRLSQQYERSVHTIGHFRLNVTTGQDPASLGFPDQIRELLAAEKRNDEQRAKLVDYYLGLDPKVSAIRQQVEEFRKTAPFKPEMTVPVIAERTDDRRTTHMFERGEFLRPLDEVSADVPEVLPALDIAGEQPSRLDLARWLVSADNPLTPRVVVNHIWAHLFGQGLVKTLNHFGVRGEPPTHPQLLDWLAQEFIDIGWSRKALIKTIVMSHTYRQSSRHRPELFELDAENRLLARQNRVRVEAEIVRDLYLAASGLLDRRIGGPSVFPQIPSGIAELSYANNFKWGDSDWNTRPDRPGGVAPKDDVHRRGMYTFFKRTAAHPNLTVFDCPDANTTCVDRSSSNTPLQALVTLNNEVFVDTARALGRRAIVEVDTNDAERMTWLFRVCTARYPRDVERNRLLDLLNTARNYYAADTDGAQEFAGKDWPEQTAPQDAAAWTTVARIVMNLDESITRE